MPQVASKPDAGLPEVAPASTRAEGRLVPKEASTRAERPAVAAVAPNSTPAEWPAVAAVAPNSKRAERPAMPREAPKQERQRPPVAKSIPGSPVRGR
jgi:hypothetical protein